MRSTLFYGPATVALSRVAFFSEKKLSYFPPFLKKSRGESDVVVGRSRVSRRLRCPPSAPAVVLYPNPADARAYDAYGQQSRRRRREVWGGKARSSDARNAYATVRTVATLSPFLLFAVAERKKRGKSPPGGGGLPILAGLTVNAFLTGPSSQVWEPFF